MNNQTFQRIEYPRPQYQREDWLNLNGEWDFAFDDSNIGEKEKWFSQFETQTKINVPFTYETKASGIGDETFHPNIWYRRTFKAIEDLNSKKAILRFQASDYLTKVWINGIHVGEHRGGSAAFSFDITNYIVANQANEVVVKVEDSLSCYQPRGKQRWRDENFGCWYVQTTGIWQTVWIEYVSESNIESVKITPNYDESSVSFDYRIDAQEVEDLRVETIISYENQMIKNISTKPNRKNFTLETDLLSEIFEWKVFHWGVGHPNLYDVTFKLYKKDELVDEITSYFGLRKVSIKDGQVLLNNVPIYQKLLLDQGYWLDTMLTPPSDEAILEDIDKTLEMGFNGVRKHQKVEDERFLYWCDQKGVLVWSEMAAAYEYSDEAVEMFTKEWVEVMRQHYNHPSIITWVPFNESWGVPNIFTNKKQQAFTESIYYLSKSIDQMRPVVVNDGWEHTISDILTLHDYEELGDVLYERYKDKTPIVNNEIPHNGSKYALAEGYEYTGQPIIISEYGGIAFNDDKGWGYGNKVETEEDFIERYFNITNAIKKLPYVSGYCYTQITDVQQEINGLLNEDRTPKIELEKIKAVNDAKVR